MLNCLLHFPHFWSIKLMNIFTYFHNSSAGGNSMNGRAFILSALIGGVVAGLLANLPAVNFCNCILCLWIWLGGILAAFLYGRFNKEEPYLTVGQGAGLGAVTGVIAAIVGFFVMLLTSSLTIPMMNTIAEYMDIQNAFDFGLGGFGNNLAFTGAFTCFNLVTYAIFGALSGMLAAGAFWKKPAV
jgi:hypothetical protein